MQWQIMTYNINGIYELKRHSSCSGTLLPYLQLVFYFCFKPKCKSVLDTDAGLDAVLSYIQNGSEGAFVKKMFKVLKGYQSVKNRTKLQHYREGTIISCEDHGLFSPLPVLYTVLLRSDYSAASFFLLI